MTPKRGTAKRKGIAGAGWLFARRKKAGQRVQLVGQRHGDGDLVASGTASDGPTGL